jgi:hypothetical protein
LTAAAVLGLATILPGWAGALIVGIIEALTALLLALRGRDRLRTALPPLPERTAEAVREDIEWTKRQIRSAKTSP